MSIVSTTKLSDLVVVQLTFEDCITLRSETILRRHLDRYVEAVKQLHVSPGINPHSKNKATRVVRISVSDYHVDGPFWWSTPGLKESGDPNGALLIRAERMETLWEDDVFWDTVRALDS